MWTTSAPRHVTKLRKAPKYKDFRKMLDKEGKNIDAVIVAIPDHMHATAAMHCMERGKHVYVQKPLVRTIWEARQLHGSRQQVQSRHPDGQPGLLQRRHAAVRRDDLERRYRQRDRSPRVDATARLAAGPDRDSRRKTPVPVDARLGPVARRRREAAVHRRRQDYDPNQLRRLLLSAVQLARLLRFRLRRAGRYGVPHPGRAEHGAEAGHTARQRGVHQEGRHQPASSSQELDHQASISRRAATCRR